jgi:hypothetical protein
MRRSTDFVSRLILALAIVRLGTVWFFALASALTLPLVGCGGGSVASTTPDIAGRGGAGGAGVGIDGGATTTDAGADVPAALGPCRSDDQCAGTTPRCDVATSRCVACAADTACAGGSVCDPGSGACVECVTNDDCDAPTATCDLTRHLCVAACRTTAQCAGRGVCDTTTGSCLGCVRDTDCARGTHCDLAGGECVDCLVAADCPADSPLCTPGHTCSDVCVTDADCNDGSSPQDPPSFCDPRNHLCVDCLRNVDCDSDSFCRADGTCG